MKRYIKSSSWKNQRDGGYGTVYNIDYTPTEVAGWELTFGAYIDEDTDSFYFDDKDPDGGFGYTSIGAIAYLKNGSQEIEISFGIQYDIFGDKDNPDEFYLAEPDRSLDEESGTWYSILGVWNIEESDAKEFIEDNHRELFDALIKVVNQNLYKFGYEL